MKVASVSSNVGAIERLYDMFGRFEMPSIALNRAIAYGNVDAALALARHEATLCDQIDQKMVEGEAQSKVIARRRKYLNGLLAGEDALEIPGRYSYHRKLDELPGYIYFLTLSNESDLAIKVLAEKGLLQGTDLKGLLLATLAESDEMYLCTSPKPSLAEVLASCGALNNSKVTLRVQRGKQQHYADIEELSDLLFPGCSPKVVKVVAKLDPNAVARLGASPS